VPSSLIIHKEIVQFCQLEVSYLNEMESYWVFKALIRSQGVKALV